MLPAVKEEMGVKAPCPSFFLPVVGRWWPEDRSSPTFVRSVLWSYGPPPSSLLPAALEAFQLFNIVKPFIGLNSYDALI